MSNNTKHYRIIKNTPVGHLLAWAERVGGIEDIDGLVVTQLDFLPAEQREQVFLSDNKPCALLDELEAQLEAYFSGTLRQFDLPLAPAGTEFQQAVWNALETIPYGETWSYKQLAEAVSRPKGYQAVGQANGRNPIVIIIPCHRVIAADGSLGGYGGGLARKKNLLKLEQVGCR